MTEMESLEKMAIWGWIGWKVSCSEEANNILNIFQCLIRMLVLGTKLCWIKLLWHCRNTMNVMGSRKTCWILTSALPTTLVVEAETLVVVAEVVGEAVVDVAVDQTATVSLRTVVVIEMTVHVHAPAVATVNVHQTLPTRWTSPVLTRQWTPSRHELGPRHDIYCQWTRKYLSWLSWSALQQWSYIMWFYCAGLLLCVPATVVFFILFNTSFFNLRKPFLLLFYRLD